MSNKERAKNYRDTIAALKSTYRLGDVVHWISPDGYERVGFFVEVVILGRFYPNCYGVVVQWVKTRQAGADWVERKRKETINPLTFSSYRNHATGDKAATA